MDSLPVRSQATIVRLASSILNRLSRRPDASRQFARQPYDIFFFVTGWFRKASYTFQHRHGRVCDDAHASRTSRTMQSASNQRAA